MKDDKSLALNISIGHILNIISFYYLLNNKIDNPLIIHFQFTDYNITELFQFIINKLSDHFYLTSLLEINRKPQFIPIYGNIIVLIPLYEAMINYLFYSKNDNNDNILILFHIYSILLILKSQKISTINIENSNNEIFIKTLFTIESLLRLLDLLLIKWDDYQENSLYLSIMIDTLLKKCEEIIKDIPKHYYTDSI